MRSQWPGAGAALVGFRVWVEGLEFRVEGVLHGPKVLYRFLGLGCRV